MEKYIKWGKNFIRLIVIKIRYGNSFRVKIFGKRPVYIGKNCKIKIKGDGKIILSDRVYIDDNCTLEANEGTIEISEGCYFNTYSKVIAKRLIKIGRDCIFGSNVSIYDHDHDISDGVHKGKNRYIIEPVEIENYVWCCTNVVITKGCRIGRNCVIAANAVVTDDAIENWLFGGVPAERIYELNNS